MSNLYKRIELVTNIAIILVALTICAVLVKRYLISPPVTEGGKAISAGEKISLPDMDWQKSRQTLLVVLSQGCHYCAESVPFYQRLAKATSNRDDIQMVAVLPQPLDEGKKYIDELGVAIKEVKQADLNSIQVRGTPTLILVDNQGI